MKKFPNRNYVSGRYLYKYASIIVLISSMCCFPSSAFNQMSVDLSPVMSPVKQQGSRNTCSVFSATSVMEFLLKRELGHEVDLSEAYNYWAGKKYALNTDFLREMYRSIDGLAGFLAVEAYRYGSMLESEWPYEPQNWDQRNDPRCKRITGKKSFECFTGVPPRNARQLRYGISPTYISRDNIDRFLLNHKTPVVMNVLWCSRAVNNRTGNVRMPTQAEVNQAMSAKSGHVITLVGYDKKQKKFKFRNSYGETWGMQGYGTIPENYILRYCEVCPHLKNLDRLSADRKKFIQQASMGVSGKLIKLNRGAEIPRQSTVSDTVKITIAPAVLVYLPLKGLMEISAAKSVVSYGEGWQKRKLQPYLFMLKKNSWKKFFWKINTATKLLYKSQYGTSDEVKGKVTRVVEKAGAPERIEVQLHDFNIVLLQSRKSLQIIAGGIVLSHGEDWRISQLSSSQYHLAKKSWRGFFWLVDTNRRHFYKVENGTFGKPGGRQDRLKASFAVN